MFHVVPGRALVRDTEFLRFCRRELPTLAQRLVSVLIPGQGKVLVGLWVSRDRGLVQPLTYYPLYEGPTRGHVAEVRLNANLEVKCRMHRELVRDQTEGQAARDFREMDDYYRERDDRIDFLRKMVGPNHEDDPAFDLCP